MLLLSSLLSCTWLLAPDPMELAPPSTPPARPSVQADEIGYAFARHPEAGTFTLPQSSRPDGAPAPDTIPVRGPWSTAKGEPGQTVYKTPLPVRSNLMATATHGTHFIGTYPTPGFEVRLGDDPLAFRRFGRAKKERSVWGFDRDSLFIGLPAGNAAPEGLVVSFARATEAENALNFGTSGMTAADFAVRTLTIGDRSHAGLFLPAPASASWTVDVPTDGRLGLRATVVPPAIAAETVSDGAVVHVEVIADGQTHEASATALHIGQWAPVRVDLGPWAGKTVEVRFRTEPGAAGDATFDYVLLEAPTVYVARSTPRRFLLVFVDTLRPDHLGMYGYERPTSPNLDQWAEHGVRFTQARSVAPWTLPSARAMLTGRQPEHFFDAPGLPERLSEAGWRTDAFVTNAFLSQPFQLHRGWDQFDYVHLDDATHVVEQAIEAMEAWPDRDTLVLLHLMEPHLPYRESRYHKRLFAGSRPEAVEYVSRKVLSTIEPDHPDFGAIRTYIVDRYDQNIRAVDDALAPLLEAAGPDATTVFVSDHGEEFWDHGGFEHGHTFYDELLHVPFVVRSPHLPPGTIDAPVSLLDVTPTLVELAGLVPRDDGAGQSLVAAAWNDAGAIDTLVARPQGFGRPLYGPEGWGVLTGGRKFWERDRVRVLHAIEADPTESLNIAAPEGDDQPYLDALAQALGRDVSTAWRVELRWPAPDPAAPLTFQLTHPDGLTDARLAYDPRGRLVHAIPSVQDGVVTMTVPAGRSIPDELVLYPSPDASVEGLTVTVGDLSYTCGTRRTDQLACVTGDAEHRLIVVDSWSPVPGGIDVSGFHPDVAQQLQELGYTGEDEP